MPEDGANRMACDGRRYGVTKLTKFGRKRVDDKNANTNDEVVISNPPLNGKNETTPTVTEIQG